MPKSKAAISSSDSDSDSGPDDKTPAKRQKPAPVEKAVSKAKPKPKEKARSDEEENSWNLGRKRFVKLTEFKGKWYVSIREYYETDHGELKPTKKGLMLTMEQWRAFRDCADEVDEAIKKTV